MKPNQIKKDREKMLSDGCADPIVKNTYMVILDLMKRAKLKGIQEYKAEVLKKIESDLDCCKDGMIIIQDRVIDVKDYYYKLKRTRLHKTKVLELLMNYLEELKSKIEKVKKS